MNKIIYPVLGKQTSLPVYLAGVGVSEYEYHVNRENGLISHQLLFTKSGAGTLVVGGKSCRLEKNSLFYIAPSIPHEYYPDNGQWTTCWAVFRGNQLADIMSQLGFGELEIIKSIDGSSVERLFSMLLTAAEDSAFGAEKCSVLLYQYILEVRSLLSGGVAESAHGIIDSALSFIDECYMQDITLELLCEKAGVSPQHFCRLFKKQMGMRPLNYIALKRIAEAKRLLQTTDKPVAAVGAAVGYPDPTYFGMVFRKQEGISPSEYRKHHSTLAI